MPLPRRVLPGESRDREGPGKERWWAEFHWKTRPPGSQSYSESVSLGLSPPVRAAEGQRSSDRGTCG